MGAEWHSIRGMHWGSETHHHGMNGCCDQPQWTPAGAASLVDPQSSEVYRLGAIAPQIPACVVCCVLPDRLFYSSQGKVKGQE